MITSVLGDDKDDTNQNQEKNNKNNNYIMPSDITVDDEDWNDFDKVYLFLNFSAKKWYMCQHF